MTEALPLPSCAAALLPGLGPAFRLELGRQPHGHSSAGAGWGHCRAPSPLLSYITHLLL